MLGNLSFLSCSEEPQNVRQRKPVSSPAVPTPESKPAADSKPPDSKSTPGYVYCKDLIFDFKKKSQGRNACNILLCLLQDMVNQTKGLTNNSVGVVLKMYSKNIAASI